MFAQELPIFDSLTHPTLSGNWLGKSKFKSSSFKDLSTSILESNVCSAVASTFPSNEVISPKAFSLECKKTSEISGINFYPAYILKDDDQFSRTILPSIKSQSKENNILPIIKLNSCFIDFNDTKGIKLFLDKLVESLNSNFVLYVCTYPYSTLGSPQILEMRPFIDLLCQYYSDIPTVLLHGGTVQILEMSQYAQHFNNIHLDLSFTICRYINSSLFYDFCYLFEYLDQKLVVGTDHPEYSYIELRQAICKIENHLRLQSNITKQNLKAKLSNIMFKNMLNLINNG